MKTFTHPKLQFLYNQTRKNELGEKWEEEQSEKWEENFDNRFRIAIKRFVGQFGYLPTDDVPDELVPPQDVPTE